MMLNVYVSVEPAPFDIAAVALGVMFLVARRLRFPKDAGAPLLLLLLFALTNLITLVLMRDQVRGVVFAGVTLYLMALWGLVVAIQGMKGARATELMLWGYTVGAGLAGAAGVVAYFGGPMSGLMVHHGRVHGLFKDANVYGAYLVPAAVYALGRLSGRTHRLVWVGIFVSCAGAIVLSYSRGAWVNLGVSVLVMVILTTFADGFSRVWWRTMVFFGVLLVILGLVAQAIVNLPEIYDMLETRAQYQRYDNVRFAVQADALEIAIANPLGQGPGSTETFTTVSAHSIYVRTLLEYGLLGALSSLALWIVSAARALWFTVSAREHRDRIMFAVITASLFGMYVEGAVIDTLHWRHFWLFLAFAWTVAPPVRSKLIERARGG